MPDLLVILTCVAAIAAALFAAWHSARSYRFSNPLFYAIAAVEVLLLIAVVWGVTAALTTDRQIETALYVSYLVTTLLIPPLAVLWGVGDRTRWGTGVVTVALFTVAVLMIRTQQIWQAHG